MKTGVGKTYYAAADLGASNGRVILGELENGRFTLREMNRFSNGPVTHDDSIHWNLELLFSHVLEGFNKAIAVSGGRLSSIAIDTWGVDYGRLDQDDQLLESPYHYRDNRTSTAVSEYFQRMSPGELYGVSGLQVQPFNTLFQLVADTDESLWKQVKCILFTPDLINFWLTGRKAAEVTIASTSGLLDVGQRQWSTYLTDFLREQYHLPLPQVLAELVEPGTIVGQSLPGVLDQQVSVVAVGSHDTASAVAAVPSSTPDFAFISSGTWSLVGIELDHPVLTDSSRESNLTNELGVESTVRYLQNIMGMWVFNECRREWEQQGLELSLVDLDAMAADVPSMQCVIDINDERLFPHGDMLGRLQELASESGQILSSDPGAVLRCIDDSLALAYRNAIRDEEKLSGRKVGAVHIVGGGSKNRLLCQLTSEATGLPVVSGPVEGTALGNLLVQAQAMGEIGPGLPALRRVARASVETTEYRPGKLGITSDQWDEAQQRLSQATKNSTETL